MALAEAEAVNTEPTQEEIDKNISDNASYYTGKRISVIILNTDTADNTEAVVRLKAEEALGKIQGGAEFAAVAKEYMTTVNPELAEKGGDLGWGYESALPTELKAALDTLEKEQLSGIVEIRTPQSSGTGSGTGSGSDEGSTDGSSTDGSSTEPALPDAVSFYLVKWTDEFVLPSADASDPAVEGADGAADGNAAEGTEAPAQTEDEAEKAGAADDGTTPDPAADTATTPTIDLSLVPEDLKQELTDTLREQTKSKAQQQYFTDLTNSEDIIINPMPAGLSYAVDMSLAATPPGDTANETPTDELTESGELVTNDLVEGTGVEAKVGDTVLVHYVGTIYGTEDEFDSSYKRGEPYEVIIGTSSVIQGWHQGLPGMKVGGKRELIIPPSLAYGATDYNGIPGNSTLKFVIELVSVNGDSTGYTPADTPVVDTPAQ